MEVALFIIAAILCAAFGGPMWATVALAGIAVGIIVVTK